MSDISILIQKTGPDLSFKLLKKAVNILNERQKRFCEFYIECGNASEAYRKAGYKSKTLNKTSSKLLAKNDIQKYIQDNLAAKDKERIANADEVLEFLTSVARGEIKEEAVSSSGKLVEKYPSLKDRIRAAELLGKRNQLFNEKVEITGQVPIVLVGAEDVKS